MMESDSFIGIGAEDISEDIPVDTKGHCLLCLAKLQSQNSAMGMEGPSSSLTSLHNLSRYLGIDLKKLIMQNRALPISSQLKRELLVGDRIGVGIKGLLCEDCAPINKQFLEVFLQLEKIQMEVASSLKLIRWKLMEGDEGGQAVFRGKTRKAEQELVEALREEARDKCSSKLNSLFPPAPVQGDAHAMVRPGPAGSDLATPKPKNVIDPKTGLIRCGGCFKKTYKNEANLLEHLKKCQSQEVGPTTQTLCLDCGEVFNDWDQERAHWRLHYLVQSECSTCKVIFPACALSKHQKFCCRVSPLETSRLEVSCRLCFTGFISMAAFKSHLRSYHKDKRLPCYICGKKFGLPTDLGAHRRGVHGIINGVTPEQRRMTSTPPDTDHDMGNGNEDIRSAAIAIPPPEPLEILPDLGAPGSTGKAVQKMESAINAQTGAHKCLVCSKEFDTEPKFKAHFKVKHLLTHYQCRQCGHTYEERLSYVMHYRRAHQLIPFSCERCNRIFPRRNQLRKHRLKECRAIPRTGACSCRMCKQNFSTFKRFQTHFQLIHE